MLADEVRLDLVGRVKAVGAAEVSGRYFYNYSKADGWHMALGRVEDRLAVLVYEREAVTVEPVYFILLTWHESRLVHIRDYRYARYVMGDVQFEA